MSECRVDSQPNHWFCCSRGTVGCPVIHDGLTPHCIQCAVGEECRYGHDPPALEQTAEEYYRKHPELRPPEPKAAKS